MACPEGEDSGAGVRDEKVGHGEEAKAQVEGIQEGTPGRESWPGEEGGTEGGRPR